MGMHGENLLLTKHTQMFENVSKYIYVGFENDSLPLTRLILVLQVVESLALWGCMGEPSVDSSGGAAVPT